MVYLGWVLSVHLLLSDRLDRKRQVAGKVDLRQRKEALKIVTSEKVGGFKEH